MSMDFFTSDQHFGHKNIIEYCNRPFSSISEMDKEIVRRWNSVVSENDTVYVLGDVSFYNTALSKRIIKKLNGKKILVRGNHDSSHKRMKDMGFDETHDKLDYMLPDGRSALLWHYPLPDCLLEDYDILIHGHTHCKPDDAISGKKINVCVDAWEFTPLPVSKIASISSNTIRDDLCLVKKENNMISINAQIHTEDIAGVFMYIKQIAYKD